MQYESNLVFTLALTMIPGIGGITARKIIEITGSPEAVFRERRENLFRIPRAGRILAEPGLLENVLDEAEREMDYISSGNIRILSSGAPGYPVRLSRCADAPLLLFVKGASPFDKAKVLGIVGTRRPTPYGLEICRNLVRDLHERGHDPVIVSGLAYGIDHCAHQSALTTGLMTLAVLGHGLRYMYPARHRSTADRIVGQGALVSDFASSTKPEPGNFLRRNRIIAGLSDGLVVVESGLRGGALITADLANSYFRDVMAFPGRPGEPMSAGCNELIKTHKAALIEHCRDLEYTLGWEPSGNGSEEAGSGQTLSKEEKSILRILQREQDISVDSLAGQTGIQVKDLSVLLLGLEFRSQVISLPGNRYRLGAGYQGQ